MLTIYIPNNNTSERKYIIDILLKDFLGLNYVLEINRDLLNYEIVLPNQKKIIILDSFFSKYKDDWAYLKEDNIPLNLSFVKNQFIVENNIPVLFGTDELRLDEGLITCGIDIFASSFFMLTRWEEHVNKKRDEHHRFSAFDSLAYKNNILHRPIVNEYVEMLWNILIYSKYCGERKKKSFDFITSHDVDEIIFWKSVGKFVRVVGGDILKRRSLKTALSRTYSYMKTILKIDNDPYDTFDWLMNESDKYALKSRFYFMSGGTSNDYDNKYSIEDASLIIEKIKRRGHVLGLHGSYNSYESLSQIKKEKASLENITNSKITEGRQHFLRFSVPTTWQVLYDAGMLVDSTCSYADKEGFRCGTGDEFFVYNILTRQKLKLKERPLIIMDGTFQKYQSKLDKNNVLNCMKNYKSLLKKYNSTMVILWHNSSLNTYEWKKYKKIYKTILK